MKQRILTFKILFFQKLKRATHYTVMMAMEMFLHQPRLRPLR